MMNDDDHHYIMEVTGVTQMKKLLWSVYRLGSGYC